jgi:hypothetical protein
LRLGGAGLFALILVLWSGHSPAWAWGHVAHAVVCEIAFQELTPTARAEINRLIGLDPAYSTFAEACNWPDNPRKRAAEHYMNVPRTFNRISIDRCPLAHECVYTGIKEDAGVLTDPGVSDADRLASLKYLGHWVGDIHQPMHISYRDDRGGNWIDVAGSCGGSLHSVWDSCIVGTIYGTDWRKIGQTLRASISDQQRASWVNSTMVDWANESYQITINPSVRYCTWRRGACWYRSTRRTYSDGQPHKRVTVNQTYLERHSDTVAMRMKQAGVRLGALLNRILGQ